MRRTAALLAYAGGGLLVYAGVSGNAGLWALVGELITPFVAEGQRQLVSLGIRVLMVLASLGGVSVILGGWLFSKKRITLGKLLVFLGAATGLIGLVLGIGLTMARGGTATDYFAQQLHGTAGAFGVILAYAARKIA